jgi:adenylosuccinate synthase
LRYSLRINGIQKIAITKLDVLDQFEEIKVCVGYAVGEKKVRNFPTDLRTLELVQPQYRTFKGWKSTTSGVRSYGKLPPRARTYLEAIAALLQTNVWMVSVGARRDQTLITR